MALLNFPDPSASPWVAPNGIVYTYVGTAPNGYWSGSNSVEAEDALKAQFVEIAGDTMTGDLLLNDKITLDATDGSAKFAGNVEIAGDAQVNGNIGATIYSAGGVAVRRASTGGSQFVWRGYLDGTAGSTSEINADGSATFAGSGTFNSYINRIYDGTNHDLTIGTDDYVLFYRTTGNVNDQKVVIKTDGSATFKNTAAVDVPNAWTPAFEVKINSSTDPSIYMDGGGTINAVNFNARPVGATDNTIELNGTDGSADFAGDVTSTLNSWDTTNPASLGVNIAPGGLVQVKRSSASSTAKLLQGFGGTAETTTIYSDGTASFAGAVEVGDFNTDGSTKGVWVRDSGVVQVSSPSGSANAFQVFKGSVGETVTITNDGSATFAGNKIKFDSNGYGMFSRRGDGSYGDVRFNSADKGLTVANSSGTVVWSVDYSGNASFRNAILDLEPDNDDNYTTTTETYEEQEELTPYVPAVEEVVGPLGNVLVAGVPAVEATYHTVTKTREVRTYTGPTLDVKERLQNLISRIDAIEANEIADDATDSALLQLVASLTTRLDERDAQIAALTARVTTLES